jgi:hypothetical protein
MSLTRAHYSSTVSRLRVSELEKQLQQERLESSRQKSDKEQVHKELEKEKRAHVEAVASLEAKYKQASSMQLATAQEVFVLQEILPRNPCPSRYFPA